MRYARKVFALASGLLTISLLVAGCRDSVSPGRPDPDAPEPDPDAPQLGPAGPAARIHGAGALGTGSATPHQPRQDFDFDVSADLTGRLFFQDWWFIQPDGVTPVSLTVDAAADAATGFTAFRDNSAACADRTRGAELDGVGRGDNGNLYAFTVAACDNGAAGSGADFFRIVAPDVPYDNTATPATPPIDGTVSSGDIVKEAATPQPGTGDLTITTATTGEDLPTGYTLSATRPDGSSVTVLFGANQVQNFPGQPAGDYVLELTDVPTRCRVENGTNPRTVTVPDGGSVSTIFDITCAQQTGDLTIITSSTGEGIPGAGYTLTVSGLSFPGGTSVPIGPNDALSAEVTPGHYDVELRDVASNCSVTVPPPNPRTINVAAGDADSTTFVVTCTAPNQPPTANFTYTCNGLTCNFTSTSSDPDGSIVSYGWNFGDNTTSTTQDPSHTYAQGGSYAVTLTVTDNRGATATTSRTVTATQPNRAPSVSAGPDQTVLLGLLYGLSWWFSDPDNGPWSYTIDWGDGTLSSGSTSSPGSFSASHNYLLLGSKTIRVTVTDSRGASGSDTKILTVLTPLPGLP